MQKYQSRPTKDWRIATELTATKKRQVKVIHVADMKAETITITIDKTPPLQPIILSNNFSDIHLGHRMSVFSSIQEPNAAELKKLQEREDEAKNRHQNILESMKEPPEDFVIVKKGVCCGIM